MKVLLVEDDVTLQRGLRQVLNTGGHQTVLAQDGLHADTLLKTENFDLLVLDLGLPRLDGLEVLQRLRQRKQNLPVLVLSARDQTEDRVRGLDTGADDYLGKPFELSEFEARVRALLRRGQGATVCIGALEWSWESRQAWIGKTVMTLSQLESTVLESLLQSPGKIIAKTALARRIGEDGIAAADNMVEVYIHRLRKKLAESAAENAIESGLEIRTVRGLGYMLQELQPGK